MEKKEVILPQIPMANPCLSRENTDLIPPKSQPIPTYCNTVPSLHVCTALCVEVINFIPDFM